MSVIRRYENELSVKVKQKDMFELLKNWINDEISQEKNVSFSENILKAGIQIIRTDATNLCLKTIHFGAGMNPYEDNYIFNLITVLEDRNLFIEEKGYLVYEKENEEWICSVKTETMPNDQTQEVDCKDFDFTPSFLKYCQKQKKLGTNLGFRITNRPIRLRWEDSEKVAYLLNQKTVFYKPITLLRTENEAFLKKVINDLSIDTALWIDDDPDLFEDLKQDVDAKLIPEEETISYFPPFGKSEIYPLTDNEDLESIIQEIKEKVNKYYIENCILHYDYDNGVTDRLVAEVESYKSIIEKLKDENAGLKKDVGELKVLSKQKLSVPVSKVAKTKKTVNISKEPLVFNGKIDELYDGEIKDMVLASLKEYRSKYVQDKTRRADVLDSVLEANSSSDICNKKAQDISNALKDYDGASPKNIAALEKLGFKVKSKSNHLKIQWYDPKYTYSIATTPSDVNAAENIVHNIIKMFL